MRLQPRFAFFANHLHPLPDRPRGNIQGFRDFFVGPSRVLEFHGAIPTLLFPISVASTFFVHARSLSIMRYEGNLSMQRSISPAAIFSFSAEVVFSACAEPIRFPLCRYSQGGVARGSDQRPRLAFLASCSSSNNVRS